MKIESGYPFYGQQVGVLVFDQKTPRIPGDPGHNGTFPYPVCYQVVEGGFGELIEGSEAIKNRLVEGALSLKAKGVRAIVGDCGLMSLYQRDLAKESGLPVMASALALIPLIWTAIGQSGTIGILTGHSDMLSSRHLEASGLTPGMNIQVKGLQDCPHFRATVIEGSPDLRLDLMEQDLLLAAGQLIENTPDIRALLIECSNLPTYSKALYDAYGIPVYDIVSAADILWRSVCPPAYR